jgi:hypothetical protein
MPLVLNSSSITGLAAVGGLSSPQTGSVLQVVNATTSTETSSQSSTYADTTLTASITPLFSTSKILVLVNQGGCGKNANNTKLQLKLLRGSTVIQDISGFGGVTDTTATNFFGNLTSCYLDSPATTSSTTYKTQFASGSNSQTVYLQATSSGVNSTSTITLLEIAA